MDANMSKNVDPVINGGGFNENQVEKESWRTTAQRLYGDVNELFQREGRLIRSEVSDKVGELKTAGGELVTGGLFLFVGVLCFAASAIIILNLFTSLWAAAVIVTAVFLIVGGILMIEVKRKLNAKTLKPNKSIDAISELRHSLKEKVNEITKH